MFIFALRHVISNKMTFISKGMNAPVVLKRVQIIEACILRSRKARTTDGTSLVLHVYTF